MRGGRVLAVGVFVMAVALMPLGGLLSGGVFETWLGDDFGPRVRVTLHDQTGLVRAVIGAPRVENDLITSSENRLSIGIAVYGGCGDYAVRMSFRRAGDGYVIQQRNDTFGCSFLNLSLIGHGRVLIALWSPVDTSKIQFESID
jgi:hypothetical protein